MFIVGFVINLILVAVMMLIGLLGIGETNSCAANKIVNRFVGFGGICTIVVVLLTLWSKYDFAMRYTNAPGNLVWVFLFFSFDWTQHFKTFYIPTAVIMLIVTVSNLSIHLVHMFSNFNQNIRRPIFLVWIGSLVLMAVA